MPISALSRKERDRQLRRSDILRAAEHIFAQKGYHKATIRDIANEAQYAAGTVYLYFSDKNALYSALLEEKIKSLLEKVEGRVASVADAASKLRVTVEESLAFFEKNDDFFRIFIAEGSSSAMEREFMDSPTGQAVREHIAGVIRYAQEQGLICPDLDPVQAAEIFIAIQKTVVMGLLKKKSKESGDFAHLSDVILRYFLDGIAQR